MVGDGGFDRTIGLVRMRAGIETATRGELLKLREAMSEIFVVDAEIVEFDGAEARGIDQITARKFQQFRNASGVLAATNAIADRADGLIARRS